MDTFISAKKRTFAHKSDSNARSIGHRFTQMNAYFLLMNIKRCIVHCHCLLLLHCPINTEIRTDSYKILKIVFFLLIHELYIWSTSVFYSLNTSYKKASSRKTRENLQFL